MDIAAFTNNPYFNLFNGVVGVVGVGLAFYFYFRSKESYQTSYNVAERVVVQPTERTLPFELDNPVEIDGRKITQLTRTYICIRNIGNKLIDGADIVGTSTIRSMSNSEIMSASVVFVEDAGSNPTLIRQSNSSVDIKFDFLRPNEGMIVRLDHLGLTNEVYLNLKTKHGGPISRESGRTARILVRTALATILVSGGGAFLPLFFSKSGIFGVDAESMELLSIAFISFMLICMVGLTIVMMILLLAGVVQILKGAHRKKAHVVLEHIRANNHVAFLSYEASSVPP